MDLSGKIALICAAGKTIASTDNDPFWRNPCNEIAEGTLVLETNKGPDHVVALCRRHMEAHDALEGLS